MAELNTVARPYAQAAFDVAQAAGAFDKWESALDVLAAIVSDERVAKLIDDPKVSMVDREAFLLGFSDDMDAGVTNLVKVMSENKRLGVLPSVAKLFKGLRAQVEKTKLAEVVTASKLSEKVKKSLQKALEKRFNCQVALSCRIDKSIIGGGIIRVDDWVVDGSVTAQLTRLETALAS